MPDSNPNEPVPDAFRSVGGDPLSPEDQELSGLSSAEILPPLPPVPADGFPYLGGADRAEELALVREWLPAGGHPSSLSYFSPEGDLSSAAAGQPA